MICNTQASAAAHTAGRVMALPESSASGVAMLGNTILFVAGAAILVSTISACAGCACC